MTKQELIELCCKELRYWLIVDENSEQIDYGAIIDFLIENGVIKIGG